MIFRYNLRDQITYAIFKMDKKQFYTKIAHLIIYYLGNVTFYHTSSQHASNHQNNNDPDGYGKESFIVFLPEELNQCENDAEDSQ